MLWLLDSNVLIDALTGLPHGAHVLREAEKRPDVRMVYSAISRVEVLGFADLTKAQDVAIREFLAELDEVPVSNAVIERTIQIRKIVRIKIPDALIAASAETANALVITRNVGDFERIPGLTVVLPDDV